MKVSLSQADFRVLADRGLKLFGLANTSVLAPDSVIEWPTVVNATVTRGAFLEVGAFCNLSGGILNNIRLGRYCSVANGVVTGSHEHPTDWLTTSRTAYVPEIHQWDRLLRGERVDEIQRKKRSFTNSCPLTTVGHDVWIGEGAFIKAGVNIGHGAIVGARATVVKDVPPYAIVVGSPAQVLRYRFSQDIVTRLLALSWWDYCIYDLFDAPMNEIEPTLDILEDLILGKKIQPFEGVRLGSDKLASVDSILSSLPVRRVMDAPD